MAQLPLGFTFYKDKTTPEMIQKRRKLSIGSNGSDSTGEKVELNESFNRMHLNALSASAEFKQKNSQGNNFLNIPKLIKPQILKQNETQSLLFGIQKYLRLDNESSDQNVGEMLQQPYQQLQKLFDSQNQQQQPIKQEHRSPNKSENKQEDVKQNLGKYFFTYGMPSNLEDLIEQTKQLLQNEMNTETIRQKKEMEEQHLENLLYRSSNKLTKEQRAEKVQLYLEKKRSRQWKQVRYSVRKNLADQRERIQGRFVKSDKPRFNQSLINLGHSDVKKEEKEERKLNSLTNSYDFNAST